MDWVDKDRIQHENNLINQRLTWLGTFEGLLFVANHYTEHPYLFPLVGLLFAISIDRGIASANRELDKLDAQAYQNWQRFLMPGVLIPKVVAAAWAILFLENFNSLFCRLIS